MNNRAALIIGYGRLEETWSIIQKLKQNNFRIYLSLDGPKTTKIGEIQDLLCKKISDDGYANIVIRKLPTNLGVACAVITGIDWFFNKEKKGIILEDDLVISNCVLSFFAQGIDFIEKFPKALMVSGSSFCQDVDSHMKAGWTHIPLIWGWGTTKEKWETIRELILKSFSMDQFRIRSPELGYFYGAAISASSRKVDTWDSPLALRMLEDRYYCLVPPANLITNIGSDEHASHTLGRDFPLFNPIHEIEVADIEFHEPLEDEANQRDKQLFIEVFKIKQKHRLSGIKSLYVSYNRDLNALKSALQVYSEKDSTRTTLVLIHFGRRIPSILIRNIEYLAELQEFKILLITDAKIKHKQRHSISKVKIIGPDSFLVGWNNSIDSKYRNGFWEKSKKRIYVLMNFCLQHEDKKVMHIESDVWLSPGIAHQSFFQEGKIRYVKITDKQASGAIMYIHDESGNSMRKMRKLLVDQLDKTDMQILAYYATTFPGSYSELPSDPNAPVGDVIFDPAMIGMHLFGEDARNRFGKAKIFAPYLEHGYSLNVWNFNLTQKGLLIGANTDFEKQIANLHIHSKSTLLFSEKWRQRLSKQLRKRIHAKGEIQIFRISGFRLAVQDYLALIPDFLRRKLYSRFKG